MPQARVLVARQVDLHHDKLIETPKQQPPYKITNNLIKQRGKSAVSTAED
jgi:hypothetical protein